MPTHDVVWIKKDSGPHKPVWESDLLVGQCTTMGKTKQNLYKYFCNTSKLAT